MIKTHYHRLVVIDEKDPEAFPLGIISSFDIVAEMAKPEFDLAGLNFQKVLPSGNTFILLYMRVA